MILVAAMLWLWADPQSRAIVPEEFVLARPGMPPATKPLYRRKSSRPPAGAPLFSSQLGLTIWRLHPAGPQDPGARLLVHEGPASEWVADRVGSGNSLSPGDRVRFSLESPKQGYLYVIDREEYARGVTGEPYLIFPTTRTRGGDNKVLAGKLIDVPAQDDQPNYLTVRKTRPDQVGELLTVIVAPEPLPEISIGLKAVRLDESVVSQWEERWTKKTEKFELAGGIGKQWTPAEQKAGLPGDARLTASEPGPQTIFQTNTNGAAPVLIKVQLRYGTGSAPPAS